MQISELMFYTSIELFALLLIVAIGILIYNRRLKKKLIAIEANNKELIKTIDGIKKSPVKNKSKQTPSKKSSADGQSQKHVAELHIIVEKFSKETREMLSCIHVLEKENTKLRDQLDTRKTA